MSVVVTVRSTPVDADLPEGDCPGDVVDRLLWRNAQRIVSRHAIRLDGTCRWCAQAAPCDARRLAVRALEVARLPWQEAWHARNEITSLLPVVAAQPRRTGSRGAPTDGRRSDGGPSDRPRAVTRVRTRTWIRVTVRTASAGPSAAGHPAAGRT
ncbi:MAG: hypothetical protein IRY85_21410 [Micromonosporaceae bacterium]|nr:hypothetical protein [Micromonosporaceae bacterium]